MSVGLDGDPPPPRQDGEPSQRQLLHCLFAFAVIHVVVSGGGFIVLFSCTFLERYRHTVSCDLVVTLPPISSYMTTLPPPSFTGSCRYLLLFKSECFSTLIDCISSKSTTTSCGSGTFQRLDEFALQDHGILRTLPAGAAGVLPFVSVRQHAAPPGWTEPLPHWICPRRRFGSESFWLFRTADAASSACRFGASKCRCSSPALSASHARTRTSHSPLHKRCAGPGSETHRLTAKSFLTCAVPWI